MSVNAWAYRPALDGLRTIAVYLVVLFHAGVSAFAGGFVGVDLFFVLSGFLVTNVLVTEFSEHGRIRLWRFYARRVRRLLPAASATIVGTTGLMLVVADQVSRLDLVGDVTAASLWYANWHFAAEATDYFASGDLASPFLHFWSLAIEEQFYLAFPVIAVVAWRWSQKRLDRLHWVFGGLALVGVAIQIVVANDDTNAAYYATHARIYQLLLGATAAAWLRAVDRPMPSGRGTRFLAGGGIAALVLVASDAIVVSASWRGIAAAAASLLVVVGLEVRQHGWLAQALASRNMRYLGQISYGTYLWHWPLLVAASHIFELDTVSAVILSGVGGTALAALSHELLEQPVRRSERLDARPRRVVAAGLATAIAVGVAVTPTLMQSERRPRFVAVAESAAEGRAANEDAGGDLEPIPGDIDFAKTRSVRAMGPNECYTEGPMACIVVPGDGRRVHLTGDSHAGMVLPALRELAEKNGWRLSVSTTDSCPWIDHLLAGKPGDAQSKRCEQFRTAAYEDLIPELAPDVLVAMMHPRGRDYGKGVFSDLPKLAGASRERLIEELTGPGVERLASLAANVVILETVPRAGFDVLSCMARRTKPAACAFKFPKPVVVDDVEVRRAVAQRDGVWSVDLDDLACPDLPVCAPVIGGLPVRRDGHHFSVQYARFIAPQLGARLAETGAFGTIASSVAPDVRATPPQSSTVEDT